MTGYTFEFDWTPGDEPNPVPPSQPLASTDLEAAKREAEQIWRSEPYGELPEGYTITEGQFWRFEKIVRGRHAKDGLPKPPMHMPYGSGPPDPEWQERPSDYLLTLRADGATPDEVARGLAAAQRIFDEAGVSPFAAHYAQWAARVEDYQGTGGQKPRWQRRIEHIFGCAEMAAHDACCAGMSPDRLAGMYPYLDGRPDQKGGPRRA